MKRLLTLLFLFSVLYSTAQVGNYSTIKVGQKLQLKTRSITDFTLNFNNSDSLSDAKIPTAKAVADYVRTRAGSGGGGSGAIVDADTASTIAILGGHLKATYSGGASTWAWINDTQHEKINVTDVIARSGFVTIKFKTSYTKIINFIVGNDETTSITANSTSGTPFYANGPYLSGARIFNDSADIYINKQYSSAILVYWNGSAWSLSQQTFFNGLLNPNSPAITIANTGSGLRFTNIPLNMRSVPIIMPYTPNFAAQNAQYSIGIEAITKNWLDVTVVENSTGTRITSFPTGFGFFLDFGPMWFNVNPLTEDFGTSNNFEIMSIMKKY